jgi:hypothetical protein
VAAAEGLRSIHELTLQIRENLVTLGERYEASEQDCRETWRFDLACRGLD